MATEVHEILDRTTKKGRVYYLVRWQGFTADQDTWESRVELRQDGHFQHIQAFEHKRKQAEDKEFAERHGADANADKSPRKGGRPSKSPSRGRSRSVKRDPSAPRRARSTSRKAKVEVKDVDKVAAPPPVVVDLLASSNGVTSLLAAPLLEPPSVFNSSEESHVVHASSSAPSIADGSQADDESDVVFKPSASALPAAAVDNSTVSQAVADLANQGWLLQAVGIFVVFLAMLGHALVPHIEANVPMSNEVKTTVLILTKTNSLPPLVTLALVLRGRNNRLKPYIYILFVFHCQMDTMMFFQLTFIYWGGCSFHRGLSKWIAICLVWRTAAEVILQLPDPQSLYLSVSLLCVGVADLGALAAVWSAVGGSQPDYDVFAQTLAIFGFALLVFSDSLLLPLHQILVPLQPMRVLVMSLATIFLSMSSILAEV
ncbi:hypothetical protein H257_03210 [Aphanomyces astaci]|uniref:Chromo domain-containing protein n=1 Tax=Aphanomyces astaci TaxID=112090 RepID=W4H2U2_APHAT|nr:hypothetical protein H257_03210 [Aphanomyces astaci]ETV85478.1 hypothetical protein H257_03210 [Aphanomyces astaci]|eukprot:XP_009825496.1 hypothetical protein H257_03210 [Aphanomyces astaci]